MTTTSQSVFVFFASFSVVIIAVDRMRFVVTPKKVQLNNKMVKMMKARPAQYIFYVIKHQGLVFSLIGLLLSTVFSVPLFIYTEIEVLFKDASYCYEVKQIFLILKLIPLFSIRAFPRRFGGRFTPSSVSQSSSWCPA